MKYLKNKSIPIFTILALVLFFTGCDVSGSDSADDNSRKVAVKMKVQSSSTSQQKVAGKAMKSVDSLTEVKMLVEELELESTVDQDSLDFEVDDLIVNLPLDGSDFVLTEAAVPEGLYDEFELEIEEPDNNAIQDPDFYNEDNDSDGYSMVIKGIYNGEAFMYRSEEDFEIEMDLNPPLEVTADTASSVAINVDPFSWFKDEAGNDLDPTDPANSEQIDENIKKSFNAEKDHDDDNDADDDDDDGDDD